MRLFLVSMVACVACGSVKATDTHSDAGSTGSAVDDAPAASFVLSVAPAQLTMSIGGAAGATTVSVARMGAVGDITLSGQNLPAGVTVTFGSPTLAEGSDSSDVLISLAAPVQAGALAITLVGTAPDGTTSSAVVSITAQLTVTGTIAGARSGVTVGLVENGAYVSSTTSDGSGNFSFTAVTPPYDVYAVAATGTTLLGFTGCNYYAGLTRPDPTIIAPSSTPLSILKLRGSTSVAGNFSDGYTNEMVLWTVDNTTNAASAQSYASGGWSLTAGALGTTSGSTTAGTLYGLQWNSGTSGAPNANYRFGTEAVTLTTGTAYTGASIPATAVTTTASLTGTVTPPAGYGTPSVTLSLNLLGAQTLWSASTTSAVALIPLINGSKSSFNASATLSGGTSYYVYPSLGASTDLTYQMVAVDTLVSPPNSSTNIDFTTPFQITEPANVVSAIQFTGAKQVLTIFTTETNFKLPNLATDFALLANTSYSWSSTAYGPFTSLDAFATPNVVFGATQPDFSNAAPRVQTQSPSQSFTTNVTSL